MKKQIKLYIYFSILAVLFFTFLPFAKNLKPVFPWSEEKCDSLGIIISTGSVKHSTYHYELTKLLLYKSGFSIDSAEIIARYCALTDQINPKNNYPYPLALNSGSIVDTFVNWSQSVAGTERGSVDTNIFKETAGVYWHFALRDRNDTLTPVYVYGNQYAMPTDTNRYRRFPFFWRIPFSYTLTPLRNWAIYDQGLPGRPEPNVPNTVMFYNTTSQSYLPVPRGSLIALGIYLHSLADSYSHEKCAMLDTIRSHPLGPSECSVQWHYTEIPYNTSSYSLNHVEICAQGMWRTIREYKRLHPVSAGNPLWTDDNNGFQDGDGIPDELEETNDPQHTATFIERWKAPATVDLNGDGVINHSDHTTQRIARAQSELPIGIVNLSGTVQADVIHIFGISPNPSSKEITFSFGLREPSFVKIEIFDILGRQISFAENKYQSTSNSLKINMDNFPSGIYFYKFSVLNSSVSGKFIKF